VTTASASFPADAGRPDVDATEFFTMPRFSGFLFGMILKLTGLDASFGFGLGFDESEGSTNRNQRRNSSVEDNLIGNIAKTVDLILDRKEKLNHN
jgi:hypothetical protein